MSDKTLTQLCQTAGCAAKIGPGVLAQVVKNLPRYENKNLLLGFDTSDDACVYDLGDGRYLIETIDFFPPMVDDPYVFGQIAAANALSDVYAMGGKPFLAMNLLCFPTCLELERVKAILQGGHDKAVEAKTVIAGGHTIDDFTPKYGLSVTGFATPDTLLTNAGAKPGDVLVLTKPLGTGILTTALKAEMLEEKDYQALIKSMTKLNNIDLSGIEVHACTDVTGFSLMGHGREMADGANVTIEIFAERVPQFDAALNFARMGMIPAGAYRNREFLKDKVVCDEMPLELTDVLFDPQTSGGLLIALPETEAAKIDAPIIGQVLPRGEKSIHVRKSA